MNNKLISKDKLYLLMNEWMAPILNKRIRLRGNWSSSSSKDGFCWYWNFAYNIRDSSGGAHLCRHHWSIYNDTYTEENINIRIYNDHIEFIEDSEFSDLSKEEMYSLYTFLKERIFGIKEVENENE